MAGLPSPLTAKDKDSFAYPTMKDRIPVIISKLADYLNRQKETLVEKYSGPNCEDELKTLIGAMSCLRYEVMTNKPAAYLRDSGKDVVSWNQDIDKETELNGGEAPKWFENPWLWMECYMYRRIQEAVLMSTCFRSFDVFGEQKENAFHGSFSSISALTMHLLEVVKGLNQSSNKVYDHFKDLLHISLWGNKCDLSISAGQENNQSENPLQQLAELKSNILVDDTDNVVELFHKNKGKGVKVSIVLDNAGFELMTDLCLAHFLLSSGLAASVHFQGKSMPWFVSDVTERDVQWILQEMGRMNHIGINRLAQALNLHIENGTMTFDYHPFWTTAHPFCKMQSLCPDLYSTLSQSDLVIFKGDLNYRKLVSDLNWDPTTEFSLALQGFHPTAVCSLRTLKADVVVGLESGKAQKVQACDGDWMTNGKWAVVSLAS